MIVVCFAASGVRPIAPARACAPAWLFLKTTPQNVCVRSEPPSIAMAPAFPPDQTWCCPFVATTEHFVESSEFAPLPVATLLSNVEL